MNIRRLNLRNVVKIGVTCLAVSSMMFLGCKNKDKVGDGSAGNPFKVANLADLKRVASGEKGLGGTWSHDKHYVQTADIDLASVPNWTPISKSSSFSGTYDGGGFTISNLKIVGDKESNGLGLFKDVSGTVANIRLLNVYITGNKYIGSVASSVLNGGTIHHCYVHNLTLHALYILAGGVTGSISSGGTVSNCMTIGGTITNDNLNDGKLGGITGENSGMIKNCYSTVDVNGKVWIGGLVGNNANGTVQYCYATGDVTSLNQAIGGIAGNTFDAKIYNCVALNRELKKTSITSLSSMGRITGTGTNTNRSDNYARSDMKLYGKDVKPFDIPASDISLTSIHGANVEAADYNGANSGTWWSNTAKFPSSDWDFAPNRLPHLKGFNGLTQNPTVK